MSDFKEVGGSESSQGQETSPGERLRVAREQSGLSLKEVASHLNLSHEKIESLERGQVDQLAAPVFVAGYLRAYAKLVGLPEDEIIADFKALAEMEAPSVDPSTSPAANNFGQMESLLGKNIISGQKDWSKPAIWGSVGIVLAVILFMVFSSDKSTTVKITEKVSDNPEISKSVEVTNDINEVNKSNEISELDEANQIKEFNEVNAEEIVDKKPVAQKQATVAEQQKSAGVSKELNKENLHYSVVVFNFKEDSWVEVNDALNKKLLYRLGKAGTSKTVWGIAPFSIQLGYVAGVNIMFNGEPYDLSRFSNRKSVKFKLGKSGDSMN